MSLAHPISQRQRILDVFAGKRPQYLPFASRLDFWFRKHTRAHSIPDEYAGMDVVELSKAVGIGREDYINIFQCRYKQLEVRAYFEQELIYSAFEPELVSFPMVWEIVPKDRAGTTTIDLITPVGKLTVMLGMLQEAIDAGASSPIIRKHAVVTEEDYRVCEYILENAEWRGLFDPYLLIDQKIGESGYPIPMLGRIPFQSLLIDVIGEEALFYALNDYPERVQRLMDLLDQGVQQKLNLLSEFHAPYVEFGDNLDGWMTNPRLFKKYSIPQYQTYAAILHSQGKKMGSHTDGDLKTLVKLLPESGLDFCESFTPSPLTQLPIDQAWENWKDSPNIWGGIPSMMLEERIPEIEFRNYVHQLVEHGKEAPFILGVCDAVMGDNMIERVRYIVDCVNHVTLK